MFFSLELRADKVQEFLNLKKGSMSVMEYSLKFTKLERYASTMVSNCRACMTKFVYDVFEYVVKECSTALYVTKMVISKIMFHAQ